MSSKKRTTAEKCDDYFRAFKCVKNGVPVKRTGARDGSVATHPVIAVPDLPEAVVLKECMAWLKRKRIFCNRHDVGAGNIGNGYAIFGIKGAGDIIGLIGMGRHLEVECKRGRGGRLSKRQQKRMLDIRAHGGVYLVVHGVLELEHLLEGLV